MTRSFLFALVFCCAQVSFAGGNIVVPPENIVYVRASDGRTPRPMKDPEMSVKPLTADELKSDTSVNDALSKLPEIRVTPTPDATPTPTVDAASMGDECIKATEEATDTCNFNSSPGAKVAMQMADQMRGQLNAASMSSPAAMCSKMGTISQAIDAAVAAFSGYCTTAYSDCESACSADVTQLKAAVKTNPALADRLAEVQKSSRACSKLSGNVSSVFQNIGSYAALEQAKSQYCGQQTDALAALCKSDPNNMLCKNATSASCADPNVAASSVVCICQANPSDPRCGSQNSGLANYNPAAPGSGSGAGGSADGGSLGDFGGTGGNGIAGAGFNGSGGNDSGGSGARAGFGRGGGGLSMGGGGGGGANGKGGAGAGGGAGGSGPNAKIIAGYGVGGAGSGNYGHGGGGAAAGGPGAFGRNGLAAGKQGLDLKKFMPGGQMDPSRGLAGVSGPDGITGPNTDIWQKIQMRYYSVGPSLMP